MAVIGFQLIIIVTISITFLIGGRKPALYLSIFWTCWTVVLLFYPPLIITQLLFTWGTYLVCRNIADSKRKIRELRDIASEYTKPTQKRIEIAANNSQVHIIAGEKHLPELYTAIKSAKKVIIILSGWVSSGVIDKNLCAIIEKKMNEGVKFYLGYGWENSQGEHRTSSYIDEAISNLDNLKSKYPENLIIGKYPNHEKILIKDSEYVICGSNNWLSNRSFRNSERSLKIFSDSLAASESERIKKDVQQAAKVNV